MKMRVASRKYRTKINHLLTRPDLNDDYPYEFLRKMTDKEILIYKQELKNQLKTEGITTKNINYYNKIYRALVEERNDIYLKFKEFGYDDYEY